MRTSDLLSGNVALFDGATGTEYQRRGLLLDSPPELLNLEQPEIVKQVHLDYINAGSQIIETNSFGGNRKRLESYAYGNKVADINRAAADIALSAAGANALVAGSVGPLGALLPPFGDISLGQAVDYFGEQIAALTAAGVEFILIETMISLEEALLALRAALESGALLVGVTMTFEPTPVGPRTAFGESPRNAASSLIDHGAHIVGSNCGKDFETMSTVAAELRETSTVPILIQPNAGIPEYSEGKLLYPETADRFAHFVSELMAAGIKLVGGCCGTTPDHIRRAAQLIFHQ